MHDHTRPHLHVQVAVCVQQRLPHAELRVDEALVQHLASLPQPGGVASSSRSSSSSELGLQVMTQ
jgi:hypothetical protein